MRPMGSISQATQEAVTKVFSGLDYERLGALYCDEGGEAFWAAHRDPAQDLGRKWAVAVLSRVPADGASLYVGAGVAELPVMIAESLERNRSIHACNLDAAECEILTYALHSAGLDLQVECRDATTVESPCDHVSLVSVCNDPVNYPMVSGLSYGRLPPVHLDLAAFEAERTALRSLVRSLLGNLARPGLVTTTFEEVAWLLEAASDLGVGVDADEEVIETAIVGDPIGFLRVG